MRNMATSPIALLLVTLALSACTAGTTAPTVSSVPSSTPAPDPAAAESAFFELTDAMYPEADTPQVLKAADAICGSLDEGETKTVIVRVLEEGDPAHSPQVLEKMFDLAVAYRCPEKVPE